MTKKVDDVLCVRTGNSACFIRAEGLPDPGAFKGSVEVTSRVFMPTAVTLKRRVEGLWALPLQRLDATALQRAQVDIGQR